MVRKGVTLAVLSSLATARHNPNSEPPPRRYGTVLSSDNTALIKSTSGVGTRISL